ncbi:MAG: cytochrome c oxidase accessory protein CcoG [Pseudomonadota bacterium]
MTEAPGAPIRYVRAAQGRFQRWRWAAVWLTQLLYFGLPWIELDGAPLLQVDLGAQCLRLYHLVLWPQELIYLCCLALSAAGLLFLGGTLVTRPWCGFACPHTVYTELFMWIERRIEGGSSLRRQRDAAPRSVATLARKLAKHGAWLLLAAAIGVTLVGYFTPVRELLRRAPSGWEGFWMGAYATLAYVNAGTMRERYCRFVCPYARFQSVMQDAATRLIRYDAGRGEPRGLRNRKQHARQLGDCLDCTLCVQVCPSGIDIRRGQQYDCIGCAACIDACDQVMARRGLARGLVGYAPSAQRWWRRPRVLGNLALVLAPCLLLAALGMPPPLRVALARERALAPGFDVLENRYQLQLLNRDRRAHRYAVSVLGAQALLLLPPGPLVLEAGAERRLGLAVRLARPAPGPALALRLEVRALDAPGQVASVVATFVPYTRLDPKQN